MATKFRKHPWVTQCIKEGHHKMTVWPEDKEVATENAKERYLDSIEKISNDPRVQDVQNAEGIDFGFIFIIDKNKK